MDKHDTETDLLKKEIMKLQLEAENANKVKDKYQEMLKSL